MVGELKDLKALLKQIPLGLWLSFSFWKKFEIDTSLNLGVNMELLFSGAWSNAVILELSKTLVDASAEAWLANVSFSLRLVILKADTGYSCCPKKKELTSVVSETTFIYGNLRTGFWSMMVSSFLMVLENGLSRGTLIFCPSLRDINLFSFSLSFLSLNLIVSLWANYFCS